jgi:chemotaxis methyl-accepting protein methylase
MIVWELFKQSAESLPALEMIASDINPQGIEAGRAGHYAASSLKEVPDGMREAYFEKKKSEPRFDFKPVLKKNSIWMIRNVFSGPPGSGSQTIFLRNNLLTYYRSCWVISRILPHFFFFSYADAAFRMFP